MSSSHNRWDLYWTTLNTQFSDESTYMCENFFQTKLTWFSLNGIPTFVRICGWKNATTEWIEHRTKMWTWDIKKADKFPLIFFLFSCGFLSTLVSCFSIWNMNWPAGVNLKMFTYSVWWLIFIHALIKVFTPDLQLCFSRNKKALKSYLRGELSCTIFFLSPWSVCSTAEQESSGDWAVQK